MTIRLRVAGYPLHIALGGSAAILASATWSARPSWPSPTWSLSPLRLPRHQHQAHEIGSMPGQYQLSLDRLGETLAQVGRPRGIPAPIIYHRRYSMSTKTPAARPCRARDDGIVQEAIRLHPAKVALIS